MALILAKIVWTWKVCGSFSCIVLNWRGWNLIWCWSNPMWTNNFKELSLRLWSKLTDGSLSTAWLFSSIVCSYRFLVSLHFHFTSVCSALSQLYKIMNCIFQLHYYFCCRSFYLFYVSLIPEDGMHCVTHCSFAVCYTDTVDWLMLFLFLFIDLPMSSTWLTVCGVLALILSQHAQQESAQFTRPGPEAMHAVSEISLPLHMSHYKVRPCALEAWGIR